MTTTCQFRWTSAALSHVGRVRQANEDACLELPERGFWAVADGMGGHAYGAVASRMIVDALARIDPPDTLADFVATTRNRLLSVNLQLRSEAARRGVSIIGSTVVAFLARDSACAWLWAGDSRLYLYRRGKLSRLTRDHSQAEEIKSWGGTFDGAYRFAAGNLITRAVGAADTLVLDEKNIEAEDGDMFLLCSDGLSNEVGEEDILSLLATGDCRQGAQALVDAALDNGGRDNISAIVIRADDLDGAEHTMLNPSL